MDDLELLRKAEAVVRRKKPPYLEELFDKQKEVIGDRCRFKAVLCGRRGGKTEMAARALAAAVRFSGYDEAVVYGARTRQVAKRLIWKKLLGISRRYELPWKFRHTELEVEDGESGASIYVVGFDKAEDIEKLRGLKCRLVILDEPSTYAPLLEAMTRDVIEPALGDVRGTIMCTGTPGHVPAGWWWEVSTGRRKKWKTWHWDCRDNPHFPDPESYLQEVLEDQGWTPEEPLFQIEYEGKWCYDDSLIVYRYHPDRNGIDYVPNTDGWTHVVGIDFGLRDSTAWVVWANKPGTSELYMVLAVKEEGLTPTQCADRTYRLIDLYKPDVVVGDANGIGAAYIAEYQARYSLPIIPALKRDKRGGIELMNGGFRSSLIKVCKPTCQPYIDEAQVLQWNDKRTEPDPRFEDHLCDGGLYGYRQFREILYERPEIAPLTRDSKSEMVERWKREALGRADARNRLMRMAEWWEVA